MLMVAMTTISFYFITVYTPTFGKEVLQALGDGQPGRDLLRRGQQLRLAARDGRAVGPVGRKPLLLLFSGLTLLTAYPALAWLVQDITFPHMLMVLLWLSFLYGSYNGAMVVALTEVVPVAVRTAGFSLAYSAGHGGVRRLHRRHRHRPDRVDPQQGGARALDGLRRRLRPGGDPAHLQPPRVAQRRIAHRDAHPTAAVFE